MPARTSLLTFVALAGLGLSACTNASSEEPGVISSGIGEVQASWSSIDSGAALVAERQVEVVTSTPSVGGLPALVGGSVGQPGEPRTATVWEAAEVEPDQGQALEVGGAESWISALTTVGDTTYVLGEHWQAGAVEPFIQSSTDRESWKPVDLPSAVAKGGIRLSQLVGDEVSGPIALGLDQEDKPFAISVESGERVPLARPGYGHISRFSAAASSNRGLVALAEVQRDEGGQQTVVFLSKDQGTTWRAKGALRGTQTTAFGVVAVKNGFLATGASLKGSDYGTSAWFSPNGSTWRSEALPRLRDHRGGWTTWLTAPTAQGGAAYVAAVDSEKLFNSVLRRSPQGRWSVFGEVSAWRTPGANTIVVADGADLVGLRTWNGLLQTGDLPKRGQWRVGGESGVEPTVSWWETVSLLGETPMLVGGRQKVDLLADGSWSRSTELTPFGVDDAALAATGWQPSEAEDTTSIASATDRDGNVFVAGEEIRPSDDREVTDESDVVGWFQASGSSKWRGVRGLAGPRAEFLSALDFHDGEWVLVGTDRRSFTGSDHSYGALWTSRDGMSWKRAKGPFEVGFTVDSWLSSTCTLPGGDLLAVGGAEDNATGSRGLAFRRVKGTWKRLAVDGMGSDVTNLDSCAGTGDMVLVQGTTGGRDGVWSTSDGKKFSRVEIGGQQDTIGTIEPMTDGFVAPGGIHTGLQQRAVVWLSKDGMEWHPIDVPTDRVLTATNVLPWNDGALVALTGSTGPELALLENATELLG